MPCQSTATVLPGLTDIKPPDFLLPMHGLEALKNPVGFKVLAKCYTKNCNTVPPVYTPVLPFMDGKVSLDENG